MELHGSNARFTGTEADWIQGLYGHDDLVILRQRILIARRQYAALHVPAMGLARRSLLETPGNLEAVLELDRERRALSEIEAQHGRAADGHERHIIGVDLHEPHRQHLLKSAEVMYGCARDDLAAVGRANAAADAGEPSGMADPAVERAVYEMLRPGAEFSQGMRAAQADGALETISVASGIITAIQASGM